MIIAHVNMLWPRKRASELLPSLTGRPVRGRLLLVCAGGVISYRFVLSRRRRMMSGGPLLRLPRSYYYYVPVPARTILRTTAIPPRYARAKGRVVVVVVFFSSFFRPLHQPFPQGPLSALRSPRTAHQQRRQNERQEWRAREAVPVEIHRIHLTGCPEGFNSLESDFCLVGCQDLWATWSVDVSMSAHSMRTFGSAHRLLKTLAPVDG